MVTVALEIHIIMQRGAHPQTAGACHPLSLSTGAGHPAPHVLLHPHCPPHPLLSAPGLCSCPTGAGLSLTGAGGSREPGCSHLFPAELIADGGSGDAAHQWKLCASHQWAIGGMSPLGWVGCAPPVSWPGKLQAEKAEGLPNSSLFLHFRCGSNN